MGFFPSNDANMIFIVHFVLLVSDLRASALPGPPDVSRSMFDLRSPPHRFMKVSSPCNLGYTENSAYSLQLLLRECFQSKHWRALHCTLGGLEGKFQHLDQLQEAFSWCVLWHLLFWPSRAVEKQFDRTESMSWFIILRCSHQLRS